LRKRRRGVWQRWFWEHEIRDQDDYERDVNYIHYNPRKHRYVSCPHAWEYSSFPRAVERRIYEVDWQCPCDGRKPQLPDFGDLPLEGLAIVKHLVEMHGGTVRAKSDGDGRGATFVVSLPVSLMKPTGGASGDGTAAAARLASSMLADLSGVTVLIVDDERDARELVRRLLGECGALVLTAASAAEALDAVRRDRPRVLVSDIGMPEQDGYQLLRAVRALGAEQGGDVPAAALTAFARSEDRTRAIPAGYQMHLSKPIEPAELVAVVASLAGRTGATAGG
jgi:CheY-like chemotaxis protein